MRFLTALLLMISSFTLNLTPVQAKAKKPVCTENVSNESCNPKEIVVQVVKTSRWFRLGGRADTAVPLTFKKIPLDGGNYLELRSQEPFMCAEGNYPLSLWEAELTENKEEEGYGDVPTPVGWYSCHVSMMGGERVKGWRRFIQPSTNNQLFVVEGFWVEED